MTKEELAEEQIKKWDSILYPQMYPVALVKDFIRKSFLAGYEAGRPKWHKVADGDLPKDENDVLVYSGEDWRMCVGRYSPKYKAWEAGCDTIAWCEIPTFDKE